MRIRTQLALAFLVISVLPLSGIVLYSYYSSLRAVHAAYEADAAETAGEMHRRMEEIRTDIQERIAEVGQLPLMQMSARDHAEIHRMVLEKLGRTAPFIQSFEFVPAPPARTSVVPAPAASKPTPPTPPSVAAVEPPEAPVVVDVQKILREAERSTATLPAEARAEIVQELSRDLDKLPAKVVLRHPRAAEHVDGVAGDTKAKWVVRDREALGVHPFEVPVMSGGTVVGNVKAEVSGREVLDRVFRSSLLQSGEVPFAVDRSGRLYTVRPEDAMKISELPLSAIARSDATGNERVVDNWVVATSNDPESGLAYGIARPIRRPLEQVKRTAAQNFAYGLALIGVALLGIIPIANHMTRDVETIAAGAERIAQGDLTTRVSIRSSNELGQLAGSFNRMAHELGEHQQKLLTEERLRREEELQRRLLQAEYQRKSGELEEARDFQLSLLPKQVPSHPRLALEVFMRTAAEVGGDYYDFHVADDGTLTVILGDATGHGARAATMVAVMKSLFSAYTPDVAPSRFLAQASESVRRMQLGRMAMGLTLLKFNGEQVTVATAGMPPLLVRRKDGSIEEILLPGTPVGTLAQEYPERTMHFASGDAFLIMSDGFPELSNRAGEPLGYERTVRLLRDIDGSPRQVIDQLVAAADRWGTGEPQHDDITFVVAQAV